MRRTEFGCRWMALKARLLRQQGLKHREIAQLLGCTRAAAERYASWDGEGRIFHRNTKSKARKA